MKKIILLFYFLFICWIIYSADLGHTNDLILLSKAVPYGDKVAHFLLYGILAFLLNLALNLRPIKFKEFSLQLGAVIVLTFAVLEEFTQILLANRNFELVDILMDILGIALFSWISERIVKIKKA